MYNAQKGNWGRELVPSTTSNGRGSPSSPRACHVKHYMRGNSVTYSRGGTCVYVEIEGEGGSVN